MESDLGDGFVNKQIIDAPLEEERAITAPNSAEDEALRRQTGDWIKPFVAPTMRMMAISSLRSIHGKLDRVRDDE